MQKEKGFFRDAGPLILRFEQRSARWSRLDPAQFRRLALAAFGLAVLMALLVWGRTRVLTNGYQIAELKQQRDSLMAAHRGLERRLEEMQSLHYAEQTARQRLGMVDINPNQVVTLRKRSRAQSLMDGVAALFSREDDGPQKAKP